jgi:predicted ribosome quality control (RQC) complex YloA/Tae2 family protein
MARPDDIWIHAHNHTSCHVVAQIPDVVLHIQNSKTRRHILKRIAKQGAVLCKRFSKQHANAKKVEIMHRVAKHVEKTSTPGEVRIHGDATIVVI